MDRNITYFSADPEDAPYVKTNVSEDMLVAKRKNTFESVEYPEIDWSQINENYLDPEFVKNGYQFITEADAKKGNPLDMQGNAEFIFSNVDDDELMFWANKAFKRPTHLQLVIWGAPGVGKTQIVKRMLKNVKDKKTRFIDFPLAQSDETSFFLPDYVYNEAGQKIATQQLPISGLPVYKPTGDPKKDKKLDEACGSGILFFDEMTRAKQAVLDICLKLINDRMLGEYKLGSGWACIGACNRNYDEPEQDLRWGRALGNRYTQINFSPSYKNWRKWAESKWKIAEKQNKVICINKQGKPYAVPKEKFEDNADKYLAAADKYAPKDDTLKDDILDVLAKEENGELLVKMCKIYI
jgi:GTPase SAR1 family protein